MPSMKKQEQKIISRTVYTESDSEETLSFFESSNDEEGNKEYRPGNDGSDSSDSEECGSRRRPKKVSRREMRSLAA